MQNTEKQGKMLKAEAVAEIFDVKLGWVYRHKRALGGFQLMPGAAVRFPENRIEQIRNDEYAIPDAKREMAGHAHDTRAHENKVVSHEGRGKKMGGGTKRGSVGKRDFDDPYGLLA